MKYARKVRRNLQRRLKDYEQMIARPQFNAAGYRKPGSNK